MKKQIITIGGKVGSGKTTTAKKIAHILNYIHFSSGDFFRQAAKNRGMTVTELNIHAEKDPSVDYEVDQILRDKGKESNLVIDSRLAFYWIDESFKVYLDLDAQTGAERMFKDLENNPDRRSSENSRTLEEMMVDSKIRLQEEKKRYQELYNIDHTDHKHFHLVIDTGKYSIDEVADMIIQAYKKWLNE